MQVLDWRGQPTFLLCTSSHQKVKFIIFSCFESERGHVAVFSQQDISKRSYEMLLSIGA